MKRLIIPIGYSLFILMALVGVVVPTLILTIQKDFHVSDFDIGIFYFLTSLLAAAGSFSGGFLTERIGRRLVLTGATLFISISFLGQSLASFWLFFLTSSFIAFYGAGVIDGGVNGLFLDMYSGRQRGGALSLLHFFYGLGAFIGPFVIGQSVNAGVYWRICLGVLGGSSLVLTALLPLQEMPLGNFRHPQQAAPQKSFSKRELNLLPFVFLALSICLYVGAELGVSSWLVKYLSTSSVSLATLSLSLFWGGLTLGRLLSRFIAHRIV